MGLIGASILGVAGAWRIRVLTLEQAALPSAGAGGEVRHTAAARGRERLESSRDGIAGNGKDRWSSREEGWQRGERDPAPPPDCWPSRTVHPPFHFHLPEGPTPIYARRVTSTREPGRRALSTPHPPRGPKPALLAGGLQGGGGGIFREERPEGQTR